MAVSNTHDGSRDGRAQSGNWFARGRQLGIGVLIAFTVKGICTTAMILTALFATVDESATEMMPHVLLWTVACIGGFCMLGGWRRLRQRDDERTIETGAGSKLKSNN